MVAEMAKVADMAEMTVGRLNNAVHRWLAMVSDGSRTDGRTAGRMGRTDESAVQHAVQLHVCHVAEMADMESITAVVADGSRTAGRCGVRATAMPSIGCETV